MALMASEKTPETDRVRWWHRGPFARREVRVSVGTVLAFLFVFYVVFPLVARHRRQVGALAHIHLGYLALGVLLEVAALVAYTQLTHSVLPHGGPRRLGLFRINLSTLALSHVSPGGTAPGTALGYRLLTQSGVSGADAGFALGTQGIGSAVVLNIIFWCSLVSFLVAHGFQVPTSLHGGQNESASILVMVAAGIGVILLGAFGGIFLLLTKGQERTRRLVHRLAADTRFIDADRVTSLLERLAQRFGGLMEDRRLLGRAVGWAAANWLLDAASLWVFIAAFGHAVPPVDLLTAYGLANILAAIPVTPGGLGVIEFVLVSMLAGFGVPDAAALSAVLAYRAVNFWLPIPFGGLAYASLEFEKRQPSWRTARNAGRRAARNVGVTSSVVEPLEAVDATSASGEAADHLQLNPASDHASPADRSAQTGSPASQPEPEAPSPDPAPRHQTPTKAGRPRGRAPRQPMPVIGTEPAN